MKSTRKEFIAAAVVATSIAGVPALAATAPTSMPPTPSPSPSPTPAPSPAAQALAEKMRSFDPHLDDAQVRSIAQGIQQNLEFGKILNPHGTKLKNNDAPTPEFRVNG